MIAIQSLSLTPYVPRKELLLFEKVGIPCLSNWLSENGSSEKYRDLAIDIEYLAQNDLVFELSPNPKHQDFLDELVNNYYMCDSFPEWVMGEPQQCLKHITFTSYDAQSFGWDIGTYGHSIGFSHVEQAGNLNGLVKFLASYEHGIRAREAIPIVLDPNFSSAYGEKPPKEQVLNIVLDELPLPTQATPLEEIVSFRSDNDAKRKLLALRLWVRETAASEKDPRHISEELNHLILEYRNYMQIKKLKFTSGRMETIAVMSAKALENLVKFKFSDLTASFFQLKKKKIELLEAEVKAPGREIAYIPYAHEVLS